MMHKKQGSLDNIEFKGESVMETISGGSVIW